MCEVAEVDEARMTWLKSLYVLNDDDWSTFAPASRVTLLALIVAAGRGRLGFNAQGVGRARGLP